MATPNCTGQPTVAQQKAAIAPVDQTVPPAAPCKSLAAAKAAGYVPVTPTGQKIVHDINPSLYRQGNLLDPKSIPVHVYVNTSHGAVLSAATYLMPRSSHGTNPPQPAGCLTQWHIHTDLCFSAGKVVGNDNGGSCSAGSANLGTRPMMHVWLTPVSGGPLAPDPPARSEVLAAMQMPLSSPLSGTASSSTVLPNQTTDSMGTTITAAHGHYSGVPIPAALKLGRLSNLGEKRGPIFSNPPVRWIRATPQVRRGSGGDVRFLLNEAACLVVAYKGQQSVRRLLGR